MPNMAIKEQVLNYLGWHGSNKSAPGKVLELIESGACLSFEVLELDQGMGILVLHGVAELLDDLHVLLPRHPVLFIPLPPHKSKGHFCGFGKDDLK